MEMTYIRETRLTYGRAKACRHISGPADVAGAFRRVVPDNTREHFVVFHLDGAHRIASYQLAHVGTANQCPVHPREVFQAAVVSGAVAVVVAHNHPSGCLLPSDEDVRVARPLRDAGDLLGIRVLDSLIVTTDGFASVG
jgi:DNA repair protein RadC